MELVYAYQYDVFSIAANIKYPWPLCVEESRLRSGERPQTGLVCRWQWRQVTARDIDTASRSDLVLQDHKILITPHNHDSELDGGADNVRNVQSRPAKPL